MGSWKLSEAWHDRLGGFTHTAQKHETFATVARLKWGDYICLSYTWGDDDGKGDEKAHAVFLDDVSVAVSKHLEKALRDLRESHECRLGMKVWVDALCVNQADTADRNAHVLRVKDIFGRTFSDDLDEGT
ncbi:hypothetical protein B0H63DRAFT_469444 [Podospora didyma]|uniref:Heterokaryon incompatibility domain-containing protein n=1 Tax=Podospora didyma TaxID=330526 RepID=A0AAE0U152_9PEZI|nr:hypothetical protein B0H63DRAFT_469444 [Podospora didyma]